MCFGCQILTFNQAKHINMGMLTDVFMLLIVVKGGKENEPKWMHVGT